MREPIAPTPDLLASLGENASVARRSYGTGSLIVRRDSTGRESWHAKVRVGRRQVWRKVGDKRAAGSREGLTRTQAEARLRRLIEELEAAPPIVERLTVEGTGERLIKHLRSVGRKRSTLEGYESFLRVHIVPFFADLPLERVSASDVELFISEKLEAGCAPKSIRNYLGLLHSIFDFAERRGWRRGNPCKQVDRPVGDHADPDVRFLNSSELEALLRAVPRGGLGETDRALYLTQP